MATLTNAQRRNYTLLYRSCLVRPSRKAAVAQTVRRLTTNRARYEKVAKALNMPWSVVAVIHSLEAGGDFTRHLHNGDPLTARTTHVPAGRPPTGNPPFTWEQSAIDALTYQGFGKWKDWSIPGTLYKLEGYNGFGYRDHHPDVPSPYLWSFSNHYTRGKYVADGRFSPTVVSGQVGAAVLLRALPQGGKAAVPTGPRVLQLSNPHLTGPDVKAAQLLLKKNPYGSFDPGRADSEFGDNTAGAVERAKWELGYPQTAINSTFGPQLMAILSGKKPLTAAFKQRRAKRLRAASSEKAIRKRIVAWANWGEEHRPDRLLAGRHRPPERARQARHAAAGDRLLRLRDPLLQLGRRSEPECKRRLRPPRARLHRLDARPPTADSADRGAARRPRRVDATEHGRARVSRRRPRRRPDARLARRRVGAKRLRFSAENAYQRRNGHGTPIWLTAF